MYTLVYISNEREINRQRKRMNMQKKFQNYIMLLIVIMSISLVACTGGEKASTPSNKDDDSPMNNNVTIEDDELEEGDLEADQDEDESPQENEEQQSPVDLKAEKVNEIGKIMVLMYHEIGEEEDVWVRTPENFRKDLKTLYDKGYRAISMKDYMKGNINIPLGTTPVVFTFDDGTKGQFNALDDGDSFEVDPNSAVGIMEDFYKEYPDFGLEGTFYVFYPAPFRQKEWITEKLEYLVDKGLEIGNHSYSHENLRLDMSTKEHRDASFVQEALGKNIKSTREIIPGYEVDSLALPYGAGPKDELYDYVVKGSYEDIEYHNGAVLLVGANPARPPYHTGANMARVPRIRASEMETENTGLYDWLEYFDNHPEERYISDGDPNTISFPKELEEFLEADEVGDKVIQPY